MSKLLIALLSFLLGGCIGMILMSCVIIGKESDNENGKGKKDK